MYKQMWRAIPCAGVGIEIVKEDDGYHWTVRELRPMMLEDDVTEGKASSLRQAKKEAERAATTDLTELQQARLKVHRAREAQERKRLKQERLKAEQQAAARAEERMQRTVEQHPWLFDKETT